MIHDGFSFGFRQPVVAVTPDLVLAVAKASNFNVDLQARANSFRTQYRLNCNLCNTEMNLDTRLVSKAEIEDPTTAASKFCVEHSHQPRITAVLAENYRKFREE